jgi:hypothetical protein
LSSLWGKDFVFGRRIRLDKLVITSEASRQTDPSSVAGYCGGRARLSPGMAIPLKAISIGFWGGGLIFEGLTEL